MRNRKHLACTLASFALALVPAAQSGLVGTWDGLHEPPGIVGGDPFSLQIETEGETVRGVLVLPERAVRFEGSFDRARNALRFRTEEGEASLAGELVLRDGELAGQATNGPWEWGFHARRASEQVLERSHAARVVDLAAAERPETFSLVGLDTELGLELDELVRSIAERNHVVGLSVACVVAGELVDVRGLGWEDFFARVPAGDETRYRWASISKPLTATAALRMAARGELELDADVRKLVPEFPEKTVAGAVVVITPRHVLTHQSGIVHYEGAQRTWRSYEKPHPFEELACGLD